MKAQSDTRSMLRCCLIERDKKGQEKGQLTWSPWHLFLAGRREGKPFAAECSLGWGGGEQYTLQSPSSAAKQSSIGRRWAGHGSLAGLLWDRPCRKKRGICNNFSLCAPFGTFGLVPWGQRPPLVAQPACLHLSAPLAPGSRSGDGRAAVALVAELHPQLLQITPRCGPVAISSDAGGTTIIDTAWGFFPAATLVIRDRQLWQRRQ